ncbi:c-type cytochrome [Rhodoplanes sp. SY1]|uniref:c-type cytochrome n=1 Tax=Rhodoplanes sp. SY1 TaxID=3166646 RepID=UPI0038B48F98
MVRPRLARLLRTSLILLAVAAAGGFLFAWSGLYNVAASRKHFAVTTELLDFVLRNSIETWSTGIETPPLDDPALAERGAGHFAGFCAPCHGAPGQPANVVVRQMLPAPPAYDEAVRPWKNSELFRVVKHGLKYTGMPAWPAQARDDEVWAMVAFLRGLPDMTAAQYRVATDAAAAETAAETAADAPEQPGAATPPRAAQAIAASGLTSTSPVACARCHGPNGEGSPAGGVPRIAGQRPAYLLATLRDYALGVRPSGIMQPVAALLSDEQLRSLADYYAGLPGTAPTAETRGPERIAATAITSGAVLGSAASTGDDLPRSRLLQKGAALAATGDPSAAIPACDSCHGEDGRGEGKLPRYPALAGQHRAYLEQQLALWRTGVRGGSASRIMQAAARNLSDAQIRAVALHYATRGNARVPPAVRP